MTDKLKADLSHMIEEHNEIVLRLNNLIDVSKNENKIEFWNSLQKNSSYMQRMKNRLLYPTAILIGKYLKLKFNR